MAVATAALLEDGMGARLPHAVREALIDIGIVCNDTVLALGMAHVELSRAHCGRDVLNSGRASFAWRAQQVDDLTKCADAHRDRLAVVLARATTWYAVYASQVASQVVSGGAPPPPGETPVLPSELIRNTDKLLPVIAFRGARASLTDQNNDVADARQALLIVIDENRRSGASHRYDDPVVAPHHSRRFAGEPTDFPEALLLYASTLTWALGVYTGTEESSIS